MQFTCCNKNRLNYEVVTQNLAMKSGDFLQNDRLEDVDSRNINIPSNASENSTNQIRYTLLD